MLEPLPFGHQLLDLVSQALVLRLEGADPLLRRSLVEVGVGKGLGDLRHPGLGGLDSGRHHVAPQLEVADLTPPLALVGIGAAPGHVAVGTASPHG